MGKDTPFITEGDDEFDVEMTIYNIIGYKYPKYEDGSEPLPPLEKLEARLSNKDSELMRFLDKYEI